MDVVIIILSYVQPWVFLLLIPIHEDNARALVLAKIFLPQFTFLRKHYNKDFLTLRGTLTLIVKHEIKLLMMSGTKQLSDFLPGIA